MKILSYLTITTLFVSFNLMAGPLDLVVNGKQPDQGQGFYIDTNDIKTLSLTNGREVGMQSIAVNNKVPDVLFVPDSVMKAPSAFIVRVGGADEAIAEVLFDSTIDKYGKLPHLDGMSLVSTQGKAPTLSGKAPVFNAIQLNNGSEIILKPSILVE